MTGYTKGSLVYSAIIVLGTFILLLSRMENVREDSDWRSAISVRTARSYREFYAKWRTGKHAATALSSWRTMLAREYEGLDWTWPIAVNAFIEEHPEFSEKDIRRIQYEAVVKDGSYDVLEAYLFFLPQCQDRDKIENLLDNAVLAEVNSAMKNNDYQELRRLSKKYSDWRWRKSKIDAKIDIARENAAKSEWSQLENSISERDLRRFQKKFSGTSCADLAQRRIDSLYDDLDFVKSLGSLKAYIDFVDNHPNSTYIKEARGCVVNELESYIFKRKELGSNERLVRSILERYKETRPMSGGMYGTGGYYNSSPLEIKVPLYGDCDYFVKLVNERTGRTVGVYVRAGETTEVSVPDGTYCVRYATGNQWHGVRLLFGLDAHYSRAEGTFTFQDGSGYSLTLQKVAYGNLTTKPMSASDF